jgi:PAS domain S-box-containing protein
MEERSAPSIPSRQSAGAVLRDAKEVILQEWERQVRFTLKSAASQSHDALIDLLPQFLNELISVLDASYPREVAAQDSVRIHAAERLGLAQFDLNDVLTEYHILLRIIFKSFDDANVELRRHERDIILGFVQRAIHDSAVGYVQRVQAKEKRAFEQLQLSEELHRQTFEAAAVGLAHVSLDGRWVRVNRKLSEIVGYSKEELSKLTFQDITFPPDLGADLELVQRLIVGEIQNYRLEKRYIRKDQSLVWINLTASVVRDCDGSPLYFISVVEDISQRKEVEKALGHSIEALEAEKCLREQFVSSITHDLRTPLAAARMNAQILGMEPTPVELAPELSLRIVQSLDRANRMIENLLDANRIRAGESLPMVFKSCELNEILTAVCDEMAGQKDGQIRLVLPSFPVKGIWDCYQLRRVFENLISNAIKYGADKTPVEIRLETQDEVARISVKNWGNPIRQEEVPYLFEAYRRSSSQATKSKKGWGIGLSLVREIVNAHHGRIEVRSDLKEGTEFIVVLSIDRAQKAMG